MKKYILSILFIAVTITLMTNRTAIADETITILSPENEAVIEGGKVNLKFKIVTHDNINHVHMFVDGEMKKAIIGKNEITFTLPAGPHKIRLVGATKSHKLLKADAEIEVTVK